MTESRATLLGKSRNTLEKRDYDTPLKSSCLVEVRTINWKKKVQERVIESRRLRNRLALKGCTFCPVSGTKPITHGGIIPKSQKSYNKHITRMKSFRTYKEDIVKKEQSKPGSGIINSMHRFKVSYGSIKLLYLMLQIFQDRALRYNY